MFVLDLSSSPTKQELEEFCEIMLASTPRIIQMIERGNQTWSPEFISRQHRVVAYIQANLHKITEGLK